MHAPMFMLVASLLWWIAPSLTNRLRALTAFIGCALFAGLSELIQMWRAVGTASMMDIGVDLAASALTIAAWWIWFSPRHWRSWRRFVGISVVLGLLAVLAAYSIVMARMTYTHLSNIYPELVDYEATNSLMLHACRSNCSVIDLQAATTTTRHGLLVTFEGYSWPGVNFVEVLPPTPTHQQLEIEFELLGKEPMDLFVIAHPSANREQARTVQRRVKPGQQKMRVYLKQILSKGTDVESLRLGMFTSSDYNARQLIIKGIRYIP